MTQAQKKSRPVTGATINLHRYCKPSFIRRQVRRAGIAFFTLLLLGFGCGLWAGTRAASFNGAPLAIPIAGLLVVLGWVANNGVREIRRWWVQWTKEETGL